MRHSHLRPKGLAADFAHIAEAFVPALRQRGYTTLTIELYGRWLRRAARWLARRHRRMTVLRGEEVPALLHGCLPRRRSRWSARACRSALHRWLDFLGRGQPGAVPSRYQAILDDYERFMSAHRGLAPMTRQSHLQCVRGFLERLFGGQRPHWSRVRPEDIWQYAEFCAKGCGPTTLNKHLSILRQFLRFAHLRGFAPARLIEAVPRMAGGRSSGSRDYLSEQRRVQLLASFDGTTACGWRDRAMALCMIDLGLRAIEVVHLRLTDIAWQTGELMVPAAKRGCGRRLPLPTRVRQALHVYITQWRPTTRGQEVFLCHRAPADRPVTTEVVRSAIHRAYRRCGFPSGWSGTHRLRRTFATRLYARGADLKHIADLLGHRRITVTYGYAQTDTSGLRALSQPWPR